MKKTNPERTSRRAFLGTVALAADALKGVCQAANTAGDRAAAKSGKGESAKGFYFIQPFDGGILHEECGPPVLGTQRGPDGRNMLNFVPDIYERYATAFRFVLDRGYRPIWIEDGFFGGAE